MITIDDYLSAFDLYKKNALKEGAISVVQCGKIKNIGISDIDCIVVLPLDKECSWLIYNPEIISSLFIHGPFICNQFQYEKMLRFTTLVPLKDEEKSYWASNINEEEEKIIVAARQARSILHFKRVMQNYSCRREMLLQLKSVLYTFKDIRYLFLKDAEIEKAIDQFELEVTFARELYQKNGVFNIDGLKNIFLLLHNILNVSMVSLSEWIKNNFVIEETDINIVIKSFVNFIEGRRSMTLNCPEISLITNQLLSFNKEIQNIYIEKGALWKGAEYPFHFDPIYFLGNKIWIRRLIKRAMVPVLRKINNPSCDL